MTAWTCSAVTAGTRLGDLLDVRRSGRTPGSALPSALAMTTESPTVRPAPLHNVTVQKSIDSRQARYGSRGLPPLTGLCRVRRSQDVWPVHARAFGPRRPPSAPCNLSIVCEVIEGAGPNERRGDPEPGGKAERPGTAQRLNGDPKDLIRAMPAKGDHPAGLSFWTGRPLVMARVLGAEATTERPVAIAS